MYTEDDINKAQKELDVRVAPFIGKTVEELIKTFLPKEEKKQKLAFPT